VLDGMDVAVGSETEGRAWIGRSGGRRAGVAPISEIAIQSFSALVEDGNLAYWSRGISPPGLLQAYAFPLPWHPAGVTRRSLFALDVPLPGRSLINVACQTAFHRLLAVGDLVSHEEQIVDVSGLKQTRLGPGHFVRTRTSYFDQHEHLAAVTENVLLRFEAVEGAGGEPAAPDPAATGPAAAEILPPVRLHVDHRRVCQNAAATWDWFPGHHDPGYARAQGQPTIYVSTLFFQGLVDRLVTDWAGPGAFIRSRDIQISGSLYAGQDAVATGWVRDRRAADGHDVVDVDAQVSGPDGVCVHAALSVEIPHEEDTEL
jgi:acyl dehydratase